MDRRQWLKSGLLATAGLPLHARLASDPRPRRADPGSLRLRSGQAGPGQAPVRLHANENPYGMPEAAREALVEALVDANKYPSMFYGALRRLIAEREGLTPDHVVLGAGSHEILRMAGTAYGLHGGEVVVPDPTYEAMAYYAAAVGAHVHRVPLTDGLGVDLEAMERRLTQAVRLVFVCNPNNPTGGIVPADRLAAFCEAVAPRTPVFVDEAYHEFATEDAYRSMVPLVRAGHNVIVSRTFSKIYGLAGMRVGYGLARPDIAARLEDHGSGPSLTAPSIAAALAAYRTDGYVDQMRARLGESRRILTDALDARGMRYVPSNTNFVFFELGREVRAFGEQMRARGFLVGRPFPPYTTWCRLSLGTPDEMRAFVPAFAAEMTD